MITNMLCSLPNQFLHDSLANYFKVCSNESIQSSFSHVQWRRLIHSPYAVISNLSHFVDSQIFCDKDTSPRVYLYEGRAPKDIVSKMGFTLP